MPVNIHHRRFSTFSALELQHEGRAEKKADETRFASFFYYQLSFHCLAFFLTFFAARTTPAVFALFARSYSNTLHHPLYETLHG